MCVKMALLPSRQFYPTTTTFIDSVQSSVYKLHFFRSTSSISLKYHKCFATSDNNVNPDLNPQKRSNFFHKNKNRNLGTVPSEKPASQSKPSTSLSSNGWLEKWNDTHQQNWPEKPQAVLTYQDKEELEYSDYEEIDSSNGGGSGSGMERIVEKLKKFGYIDDVNGRKENVESRVVEKGSIEDIFYVEEGMLPNPQGAFSPESPLGVEDVFRVDGKVRFPWEKPSPEEEERRNSVRLKSRTSVAEMTIPQRELRRLRVLALRTKNKTKIGGAGVTQEMVKIIRDKWKSSEIVKLKIEGAPALNMKQMHETLERKTGGLVIWRSGSLVALYRGVGFEARSERPRKWIYNRNEISHISRYSSSTSAEKLHTGPSELGLSNDAQAPQVDSVSIVEGRGITESLSEEKYEEEVDKLLDGLGPRYTDWPGCDPLPVDADLLPGIVPGYQPPFRILPYGVRATLGIKEATSLRRLARVLPPHFALGRSRQHQGLAMAMIKLWERSSIAKITLKRGVQLTTSERMAEEIKKLTGGILLSRNKDFLVFYRGKNFLSPDVAEALLEKERLAKSLQDEEEQARLRASALVTPSVKINDHSGTAGTLGETLDANARWGKKLDDHDEKKMLREAEVVRHAKLVRKLEKNLAFADRKLMRAERTLAKVESYLNPAERPADQDSISDEERFMFRKLGLKMKAFLLLGRRGVFDGTVENMHLHWKYRELVKIIANSKNFEEVKNIALSLEAESGGLLVSVDKISKGYAIIVFRGKDYKRPSALRPKNLLTKRKALARSIELQRRQALLNHISTLQTRVDKLRSEIEHISILKDNGNEELYDRLDSDYPTEDEDSEDDEDKEYLETYDSDKDVEDESSNSIHNNHLETNFPSDHLHQESETYHSDKDVEDESSNSIHNIHSETKFPSDHLHLESETEPANAINL